MNAWSTRQYEDMKRSMVIDIDNLTKRIADKKKKLADSSHKEKHVIESEVRKLEKYLKEAKDNLERFEFRYTHNGRGPEEWYEEELPEGTERIKRKRVKYPKDIDFNTLVVINPKTGKPYPVYKLRALYREGKLELPE